ncbi:MAG: ferrochelatase [Woeseiaceae bacterium]
MPTFESHPKYEHEQADALGVLVVNLGTPDAPTSAAVRRYLRQFLWDPRVVEYPRILWWLILNLIILVIRPSKSAHGYQQVWTERGSPLLFHCRDIVDNLQKDLSRRLRGNVQVELAMTYGNPSIEAGLNQLHAAGARRILILPLYPQYSATTTASAFDGIFAALARRRWVPELRLINHYHDEPGYIAAMAASIDEHWQQNGKGNHLLFSFHGLPEKNLENGDPYHCHCLKTARLVAEKLELPEGSWSVAFQSRVGREKWLQPYTEDVLEKFGQDKMQRVDVVCPGFSVDCLETLEEIDIRYSEDFVAAGGGSLNYIPCLNARNDHVEFLSDLVRQHVRGWPEGDA